MNSSLLSYFYMRFFLRFVRNNHIFLLDIQTLGHQHNSFFWMHNNRVLLQYNKKPDPKCAAENYFFSNYLKQDMLLLKHRVDQMQFHFWGKYRGAKG